MRTLGVDVSHWQRPIDWIKFYEGGVRFCTAKVSQGNYLFDEAREAHILSAAKENVLTGGFFWVDPLVSPEANVDKALDACVGLPVKYLCPDLEQWWQNWEAWRLWRNAPANYPKPTAFDRTRLSQHCIDVCDYLATKFDGPTFPYTSTSFIKGYAPGFAPYLSGKKAYLAQYYYYPLHPVTLTWSGVRSVLPPDTWQPNLPVPDIDARVIQWSGDKVIATGYNNVIDLDYFNGTETEALEWLTCKTSPPPIPPPPTNYVYSAKVIATTLNVRTGPDVIFPSHGPCRLNDTVKIYEERGGWGRITDKPLEGWIKLSYTKKVT